MTLSRLDQTLGTLTNASHLITNSSASYQNRLHLAYLQTHCLSTSDFPTDETMKRWRSIWQRLTEFSEPYRSDGAFVGDVRYTLSRMTNAQARQLAHDICDLQKTLKEHIHGQRFATTQ